MRWHAPEGLHACPGRPSPNFARVTAGTCATVKQQASARRGQSSDLQKLRPSDRHLRGRKTRTGRGGWLRSSSARHRRRSRTCICDQACGPPTLSVEKPLVGKVSAALPRDGRESPRRETGDHMPGRRRMGDWDCAGSAVVKIVYSCARAAPPATAWPDCSLPAVAWLAE